MRYMQVNLGSLPISLACFEDATISFTITQPFKGIYDNVKDGISAFFFMDKLKIGCFDLAYNARYPYKTMPDLLSWLKQQDLRLN